MTKEEIRKFRVFCITTSNRYGCYSNGKTECKLANQLDAGEVTTSVARARERCVRKSLPHVQNVMKIEACVLEEIIKAIWGAIEKMSLEGIKNYFRRNK